MHSLFIRQENFFNFMVYLCFAVFLVLLLQQISYAAPEVDAVKVDDIVEKALNASPDLEKGKDLYRQCAVCHSPEGWGTPSGHFPQISGQYESVIIKQLTDIHQGNRDNPTMLPFTGPLFSLGWQALADVSAYISKLPMVPNNSVGYGAQMDVAKILYDDNCEQCHGENGEGKAEKFYPRIQGQHFSYLERQLHWIRDGKRRNADKKMVKQIQKFHFREIEIIADYVSRMRPDKSLVAESMSWKNPDFRTEFYTAPRN
jgi:cytochrome c553